MDGKRLTWLHISDIHMKADDPYDRDLVINAFQKSISRFKSRGLIPDVIFFTGDVAYSGKEEEYKRASTFFDMLLSGFGLTKEFLFIIPGNHDVDRTCGAALKRTLASQEESNRYFIEGEPLAHIRDRQKSFISWHDDYFSGFRKANTLSTCGPYSTLSFGGFKVGILPINTTVFCHDDFDVGNLWVGRRSLESAIRNYTETTDVRIALMHHPLEWLNEIERTQITSMLYEHFDLVLRGHLHQTELLQTSGTAGTATHLAAGACYQGSNWPNRAMFVDVFETSLRMVPIRFDDLPTPLWTLDTSLFPDHPDYTGVFSWRTSPEPALSNLTTSLGSKTVPAALSELGGTMVAAEMLVDILRRNFEHDLFASPTGRLLYVEPRLSKVSQSLFSLIETDIPIFTVEEIIKNDNSYIINVPPEHGGTSLSKRLAFEFERVGVEAALRDALLLPNYRAKLRPAFEEFSKKTKRPRVLILDNYNFYRHEKLLKEIQSLELFERYIVFATFRSVNTEPPPSVIGDINAESLFLWSISRSGIREIASGLLDSADSTYLSAVVEKVYSDLLALSIPLTPSNIIMYLKILDKERDFYPFNRVDIVHKYLTNALTAGAEVLAGSFNSREKIDILSEFSHNLFSRKASHFLERDWFEFCKSYMENTLSSFSAKDLLRGLEETRVLVRYDDKLYFKYGFFLSFLVGRHVANHPEMVKEFLEAPAGQLLYGVIETIAGLTGDGTNIIDHITSDLEKKQGDFAKKFVPLDFDPMSKAEWSSDERDDQMWQAVSKEVEEGPIPTSELDLIRTSFRAEARTVDQRVRYSELKELEHEVFRTGVILGQALKAAHGVRAAVKKRAIAAYLRMHQIGMQIGIIQAREIAKRDWFQWGGAIFIGWNRIPDKDDDETSSAMAIIVTLPGIVSSKAVEDFGSRKLGEAFKAALVEQDPESFLSLVLFELLVHTKPSEWEVCADERIRAIEKKAFYLSEMLNILMKEYKTGVNTLHERECLKRLIATIYAKRSYNKNAPGAKLVRDMLRTIKTEGILEEDNKNAAHS